MNSEIAEELRSSPEGSQTLVNLSPEGNQATLVHAAAVNGNKPLLQRLLQEEYESLNQGDQFGRTPLVYSVLGDRLDCAELLLRSGANVNQCDEDQRTPLHWAAYQGNHKCVKLLITKGANWKSKDNDGRTPLHFASSHCSSKCLSLLLKQVRRGEANEPDSDSMTPLHWSVSYDNLEHTKLLLKAGASITICDNEDKSPLHWAATNKNPAIAKLLLDQNPEIINWQDVEGRTPLHLAVAQRNEAVVETLISFSKCDVSIQDKMKRSPLHWAAILGSSEIVIRLLQRNADYKVADGNGATAWHYAAQSNFASTVEVFLSYPFIRDVPDNEGRTALMWAASKGANAALQAMLRKKLDVSSTDKTGGTALHAAAFAGHLECTHLLLEYHADPNALDILNHTPLFRACEQGHTDVVSLLINGNAAVDLEDHDGHSPLHWAALGGYSYICQILIDQGVEPDKKDNSGRTPLHCAAYGGFVNCMSILLENGVDVNMGDQKGVTALHWSCSNGQLKAVELLLKYNAFPNHQSREGKGERWTPLDYAISGDNDDVAQYMVEQGAFTIEGIRDIAATTIQFRWRGFQIRKSFQNRKNLLMRHEQLKKNSKRKSSLIDRPNLRLLSPQKSYSTSEEILSSDEVKSSSDYEQDKKDVGGSVPEIAGSSSESEQRNGNKLQSFTVIERGERGAGDGQTDDESSPPSTTKSTTGKPRLSSPPSATKPTTGKPRLSSPPSTAKPTTGKPRLSSPPSATKPTTGKPSITFEASLSIRPSDASISEEQKSSNEAENVSNKTDDIPHINSHNMEGVRPCIDKNSSDFEDSTHVDFGSLSEHHSASAGEGRKSQVDDTESGKAELGAQGVEMAGNETVAMALAKDEATGIADEAVSMALTRDEEAEVVNQDDKSIAKVTHDRKSASLAVSPQVLSCQLERYRKEKQRVHLIRLKVNAAVTIQRVFRAYTRRTREHAKHQELISRFRKENEEIRREIAALTIQCTWHKHQRQQLQSSSSKRMQNLDNLSLPVVGNGRRQSNYGNNMQTGTYLHTSPKLRRDRKQDSVRFPASSAALSYNLALDLYHPMVSRQGDSRAGKVTVGGARVRPKSMKRTKTGWVPDLKLSPCHPGAEETWTSKSGRKS